MTAVLHRPGQIGAERQESASAMPELQPTAMPPHQRRHRLSLAWQHVRRAPATMCFLAAVWVAGARLTSCQASDSRCHR